MPEDRCTCPAKGCCAPGQLVDEYCNNVLIYLERYPHFAKVALANGHAGSPETLLRSLFDGTFSPNFKQVGAGKR